MSRRIILFIVGAIFFSSYHFAYAGLIINEIMYDPEGADTDREWIEVYNDSDAPIDLSTFKFFEADTNHGLTLIDGDANIPAQGYALIVADHEAFKADWPSFSGTIFDSSFSLSNEGEMLAIKDDSLNVVNQHTYSSDLGGAGDGGSLQLIDGSWSGSIPTPGVANQAAPVDNDNTSPDDSRDNDSNNNSNTVTTASKNSSSKKVNVPGSKIKVIITIPKIAFTGISFELSGEAFDDNVRINQGKYFWNFGDGNSKEVREKGNFSYIYPYEGDYVVSLEYYMKSSSRTPDATAKIAVKVVPASVLISKVGDSADFFIELSNNTNYEMDISGWILASSNKTFIMPKNSHILSKKKIVLSPKITNFSILDKNALKLMTPQNELAFDYGASIIPALTSTIGRRVVSSASSPIFETSQKEPVKITPAENKPAIVPAEMFISKDSNEAESLTALPNLGGPASALESDVIKDNYNNSYLPILISIIFIFASASAVYFIRQKGTILKAGDDFKILDK